MMKLSFFYFLGFVALFQFNSPPLHCDEEFNPSNIKTISTKKLFSACLEEKIKFHASLKKTELPVSEQEKMTDDSFSKYQFYYKELLLRAEEGDTEASELFMDHYLANRTDYMSHDALCEIGYKIPESVTKKLTQLSINTRTMNELNWILGLFIQIGNHPESPSFKILSESKSELNSFLISILKRSSDVGSPAQKNELKAKLLATELIGLLNEGSKDSGLVEILQKFLSETKNPKNLEMIKKTIQQLDKAASGGRPAD